MLLRAVTRKGFILTIHTAETSGASAVRPVFRVLLLAAGLCAVMSVAGSAPAASSPGQGAAAAGTFAPVACSEVRLQLGERVVAVDSLRGLKAARCGYLVAPENRSQPIGRTIRLAVAIVPPVSPTPAPDPIVYLAGGPGGSAIAAAPGLIDAGFNRDRELILVDQRGVVGFSKPALACPESARFVARRVGLVYDAASTGRRQVAATRACHRRLAEAGIDLAAYNTTENAADFADLRTALEIPEWNVFGVSYGTDLALTVMREHPEGIRSVTLDSVVPPQTVSPGGFWDNAREGFDNVFAACAAQRRCHERHPQVRKTFTRLVGRLETAHDSGQADAGRPAGQGGARRRGAGQLAHRHGPGASRLPAGAELDRPARRRAPEEHRRVLGIHIQTARQRAAVRRGMQRVAALRAQVGPAAEGPTGVPSLPGLGPRPGAADPLRV
jgi:pimeloyl-ACP methyl ester carboxylesterase